MTLKELEVGDRFVKPNDRKVKWIVRGNPVFNIGYGSSTRVCQREKDKMLRSMACKIPVEQLVSSIHKEAMKLKPINFR